jgi:hypothetical protein
MSRWGYFILIGAFGAIGLSGRAWAEASGTIAANPNPCMIAHGAVECTSHITWSTQGATHARVFVVGPHKTGTRETEFGVGLSCESQKCRAPWIKKGNSYVFTLYDYSSGTRGHALATVTVSGK